MTINEMRTKVCIRANALIHNHGWSRKRAFTEAWAKYKREVKMTAAQNLKAGDVVRADYGAADNTATITIVSIAPFYIKNHLIVKALNCGNEFEFCAKVDELFEKVAA